MPAERLQKLIASAGIASRRAAEEMIRDGRVLVDGRVAELGQRADASKQRVTVDGRQLGAPQPHHTLMLNKPEAVLVTRSDERGRRTVYDLLEDPPASLRYAGRLDRDSSGLLLMTTDGQLQHRITHPRYELAKVYEATLDATLTADAAAQLRRGVVLSDGRTAPAIVEDLSPAGGWPRVRVTIHEGRNRQVRRMFEAVGRSVERLRRTAVGPIQLGRLPSGGMRELTDDELRALRAEVGLEVPAAR
jgi:23S rRNA pseudouridine2605 synthase